MTASDDNVGTLPVVSSEETANNMLRLDPTDPFVTHPARTPVKALQSKVLPLERSLSRIQLYKTVDLGRGTGTIGDDSVYYTLKASILVDAPTDRKGWGLDIACDCCPDVPWKRPCEHRVTLNDEPIRSCVTREELKSDGLPLCEPRPGERITGPITYLKATVRRTRAIDRSKEPELQIRDDPADILVFAQIDSPSTAYLPGVETPDESMMTEQVESPPCCDSGTPLPRLEQWESCQYTDQDARLCQWATFEGSRETDRTAGATKRYGAIRNFPQGIYLPC